MNHGQLDFGGEIAISLTWVNVPFNPRFPFEKQIIHSVPVSDSVGFHGVACS